MSMGSDRKAPIQVHLFDETSDELKSELRAFFDVILNTPSPQVSDQLHVSPRTPPPDPSRFSTVSATLSPRSKTIGTDDVLFSALRTPAVIP